VHEEPVGREEERTLVATTNASPSPTAATIAEHPAAEETKQRSL